MILKIGEEQLILQAATGTMLEVGERIWGRGELTDGSRIQYKENYEVYISKPPFPAVGSQKGKPFNLWSKPPKNLKGDAQNVKGGWYPTYLAAKAGVNRADLPFELTGSMRQDWFGGVVPRLQEENELSVFIEMSAKNRLKAEGLSRTKGEFLRLSDAEVDAHHQRVADLWAGILG